MQNFLDIWLTLVLGQEMYKTNVEHFIIPDSKETINYHYGYVKRSPKTNLNKFPLAKNGTVRAWIWIITATELTINRCNWWVHNYIKINLTGQNLWRKVDLLLLKMAKIKKNLILPFLYELFLSWHGKVSFYRSIPPNKQVSDKIWISPFCTL